MHNDALCCLFREAALNLIYRRQLRRSFDETSIFDRRIEYLAWIEDGFFDSKFVSSFSCLPPTRIATKSRNLMNHTQLAKKTMTTLLIANKGEKNQREAANSPDLLQQWNVIKIITHGSKPDGVWEIIACSVCSSSRSWYLVFRVARGGGRRET